MDKYSMKLTSRALRDLDGIYAYIAGTLSEPGTALSLVERIEKQICSLEYLPYRCPEKKEERMPIAETGSCWLKITR